MKSITSFTGASSQTQCQHELTLQNDAPRDKGKLMKALDAVNGRYALNTPVPTPSR